LVYFRVQGNPLPGDAKHVTALSLPPGLLHPTIGHELRNKKSKNNKTLKDYEFAGRKFNN
jgi:hypothetical protein